MWIISPAADLIFLGFGWIPFWLAFHAFDQDHRPLLLAVVLSVNFVHRSITHLFVYGDPDTFRERKRTYLLLPLVFALLTGGLLLIKTTLPGGKEATLFVYLVTASVLWNFYHSVMQKVGILRIYSRKCSSGKPWIDRAVILAWFVFTLLQMPLLENVRQEAASLSRAGIVMVHALESHLGVVNVLSKIALAVSVFATALYIREEVAGGAFNVPKNLFVLSVLMLYATFFFGFLPAFAAFGFSHSVEYLAFTNHFARKKYGETAPASFMRSFVKRQAVSMALFTLLSVALYLVWHKSSGRTLAWFVVGSSFLHYIYDGWIWKLRKPKVGAALGLAPSA